MPVCFGLEWTKKKKEKERKKERGKRRKRIILPARMITFPNHLQQLSCADADPLTADTICLWNVLGLQCEVPWPLQLLFSDDTIAKFEGKNV
jgi:hypothetical protein